MTFEDLVARLHAGEKISVERIGQVLVESGTGWRELVAAILSRPGRPGDRCPCGGKVRVRSSRGLGRWRLQILDCGKCGRSHGRRTVPLL